MKEPQDNDMALCPTSAFKDRRFLCRNEENIGCVSLFCREVILKFCRSYSRKYARKFDMGFSYSPFLVDIRCVDYTL